MPVTVMQGVGDGLMPGANPSGTSQAVPTTDGSSTPAIGGSGANPFLPQFPTGANTPDMGSSINLAGLDPSQTLGFNGPGTPNQQQFTKDAKNAGMSTGVAELLFNFLRNGAGFNPQVAQALIAAMQPGVERKETNLLEQFSSMGLRDSSAAAIGVGDFLGQVQLDEGQIFAKMYEDSVQNYMSVLMGMPKRDPKQNLFQGLLKWIQVSSEAAKNGAEAAAAGGAAGG